MIARYHIMNKASWKVSHDVLVNKTEQSGRSAERQGQRALLNGLKSVIQRGIQEWPAGFGPQLGLNQHFYK